MIINSSIMGNTLTFSMYHTCLMVSLVSYQAWPAHTTQKLHHLRLLMINDLHWCCETLPVTTNKTSASKIWLSSETQSLLSI